MIKRKRKSMSMILILAMMMAFSLSVTTYADSTVPPTVLKVSEEVRPGGTISIYGEHLTSALNTHVYLMENDNQDLTIQQYDPEGHVIRVILPSDVPAGAYTLKVQN